jgi:hypothetical protein
MSPQDSTDGCSAEGCSQSIDRWYEFGPGPITVGFCDSCADQMEMAINVEVETA